MKYDYKDQQSVKINNTHARMRGAMILNTDVYY